MFGNNSYQAVAFATDSPWKLIDRLYEGAIARIDEGRLDKAVEIVSEGLHASLNPDIPMSRGMADVYELVMLHLTRPEGSVPTARHMLVTMREAWQGIQHVADRLAA